MSTPSSNPRSGRFAFAAMILISVTLLVMGRICANDFTTFDDDITITHNPKLNPPTLATLVFYWRHFEYRLYAPLTYSVWAGLAAIAHVSPDPQGVALDPLIFHSTSVLLHLLAALVVFRILGLLGMDGLAGLCGALLFAIHPVQVEPVAWASGLKDVLSGTLALAALWQYVQFAVDDVQGRGRYGALIRAMILLLLSTLAKSSSATLPLAAIAIDRWIVGRPWKRVATSGGLLLLAAAPFFAVAVVGQGASDLEPLPAWQRPLIVGDSLAFYCRKLIWPIHLCIDYGRRPWFIVRERAIYFAWMIPGGLGCILFLMRKRAPALVGAAIVFVAGCLPTLGFAGFTMQFFSTTADHYLYWAMLGPAIAVGWVLQSFAEIAWLRGSVIVVLVALGGLSFRQGGYWADDFSLFEHTAAVNPKSFLAYNNLGSAYERESNWPAAVEMFHRSIAAKPNYPMGHSNLGSVLHELGDLEGSIKELRLAVALQRQIDPRLRMSWVMDLNRLGQTLVQVGRPAEAVTPLRESLAAQPDQPAVSALLAAAESQAIHPSTTRSAAHAASTGSYSAIR